MKSAAAITWNPEAKCDAKDVGTRLAVRFVGGVLEVVEEAVGTTGTRTYVWKYDLASKLRSTSGLGGDAPSKPMTAHELEWVRAHRVPLAENAADHASANEPVEELALAA